MLGRLSLICLLCLASFGLAARPLTVAVDNSPPYSFVDEQGNHQGLSVTLATWLAGALSTEPEFINCPWARCLQLVEDGEADLLVGISKSPQRARHFYFLEPAFFSGTQHFAFYLVNKNLRIQRYEDVLPLIVGTLRGSKHYPEFDNDPRIQKAQATDIESLVNMLHKGNVDTIIHLQSTMQPLLPLLDPEKRMRASEFRHTEDTSGYIALSRKSMWFAQRDVLERALQQKLDNGELRELFKAYGIAQPQ